MVRILERYKNEATGAIAFKRLVVRKMEDGLFYVVKEFDYGNGAGLNVVKELKKGYKTLKGAEKALEKWKPERYQMTRVEWLMQEGKI